MRSRLGERQRVAGAVAVRLFGLLAILSFYAGSARTQYRFTQWTAESGLPQNSVRGLVQTPDGFIWVATLNGVAKFDGVQFQVFDKSTTQAISSSRFTAMVRGEGGDLWLTSEDGNVVHVHGGTFTLVNETAGIPAHSVGGLTADAQGNVWVESNDMVFRWNPQTRSFVRERFSIDGLHFHSFWWVGTGFWASRDREIFCFRRGQLRQVSLPAGIHPSNIRGVASGADGTIWIGTVDGRLGRIHDGPFRLQSAPYVTPTSDPAGPGWAVEISSALFERALRFPADGGMQRITYNILTHDNEGNLWVGSEDRGLFRIQSQSIQALSTSSGLASDNVYPILRSRTGDMWVGSWPGGLSQVRDGHVIRSWGKKEGLPGLISALAEDRDGALWVGTHGGVRKLIDGRLLDPKLPIRDATQAIHQMLDGTMLFGTPHGLYVLNGAEGRRMSTADGLASDDVRAIMTDRRGDTWIAGYGGLTRSHQGTLTRWTEAQGLPSNNIRCVIEDSSGDIWLGTYDGGIGWLRGGRWFSFNKDRGLFDNGAFQMLEDSDHRFWISSNRGIYRVDRNQLAAVADGKESLVTSVAYGRSDGMLSVECNGGLWPAGARDGNGAFWFPTQMGVAIVSPAAVHIVQQPPRVSIEAVLVDEKPQGSAQAITMRPGQTNLQVTYTALSFTKPEQTTFQYKLDGVDERWQQVGHRRNAYYTHLPPGNYTFRVAATNRDGIRSVADALLSVSVTPPFYRQTWFIAVAAVTALLVLASVWRLRLAQHERTELRRQRFTRELIASQEGERRRIAAELHDSLGQRLIIITNLALFLLRTKGKIRTEEEKKQTIVEINEEASAALEETRSISYALRPFQLDRLGMTRAIRTLCSTVARASEIEVTTDLENIDEVFPEDLRINVYRIVQEALNNVLKHSGATRAVVASRNSSGLVTLTISDNGRGLPPEPRTHGPGQGGFGMIGMHERVSLLNGSLDVSSTPATGTLLTMRFRAQSESKS